MANPLVPSSIARLQDAKRHARRVQQAIQQAVRESLIEHKRLGHSIAIADEHGNPVWVPAEEIDVTPFDDAERKPPSEHNR